MSNETKKIISKEKYESLEQKRRNTGLDSLSMPELEAVIEYESANPKTKEITFHVKNSLTAPNKLKLADHLFNALQTESSGEKQTNSFNIADQKIYHFLHL